MNRHLVFVGTFMILLCATVDKAYARRGIQTPIVSGIPIPIVWGHGEDITELGDLPPEASRAVADELGAQVKVAFLYNRAHVFWLDLWTWNGRHVLYSGDKYWEPDSTAWHNMIGGDPSSKYGTPILYRLPLLPSLFLIGVVVYAVRKRFFKTEQEKLDALMKDHRYQRSVETIFGNGDQGESAKVITTLDEQRLLQAKNDLIGQGVDAHTAEANLRKIADTFLANTNAHIDAYLAVASQLDQRGDWDKSADIYSQLLSSLPQNDERLTDIRNCLASVNEKRATIDAEQSDKPEPPIAREIES